MQLESNVQADPFSTNMATSSEPLGLGPNMLTFNRRAHPLTAEVFQLEAVASSVAPGIQQNFDELKALVIQNMDSNNDATAKLQLTKSVDDLNTKVDGLDTTVHEHQKITLDNSHKGMILEFTY